MAKKAADKVRLSEKFFKNLALRTRSDSEQWSDEAHRAAAANEATKLSSRIDTDVLKSAFDRFELDHNNPHHWRMLLDALARAHFQKGKEGRPPKWTEARLGKLRQHVMAVLLTIRHLNASMLNSETIAGFIKTALPNEYADTTVEQIRRQVLKILP